MTYGELENLSSRAAGLLREQGIDRGDRVAIMIPNVPAFPVWYFACLRLGAIAVTVSTRLNAEEVAFILSDCGAAVLVAIESDATFLLLAENLPECVSSADGVTEDGLSVAGKPLADISSIGKHVCANMRPDDPATILYTSGTTGFPKGATLSHQNVRATVHAFNHLCGMQPDDCLLLSVPLFHCYGQNAILNSAMNVGATIVLQRRFDLAEARQLIARHRVSMLFGVPMTFQLLHDSCEPRDLASIRYCFSAAAKLPEQVADAWRNKFQMPIYEGYGLTETAPFASYNHRLKFVPGSIGTPVDLVEMKVVDPETGKECTPDTPGELIIRGPNVMLGYWNRPEDTATAIRDGWFHSGDIGRMDENGFFYIVDRLKDMIVVSGLKVFPAEVERVLHDHPAVSEAAVVGFPDATLGEKVLAFIVAADDVSLSEEDLRAHCRTRLGSYKIPSQIVFIHELPRNPAGKVLKTQLRELDPSLFPSSVSGTVTPVAKVAPSLPRIGPLVETLQSIHPASRQRHLTTVLQEQLRSISGATELLDAHEPLVNADVDSLTIVQLIDDLQRQLGSWIQLSPTLAFDHPRLADLAGYIADSMAELDPPEREIIERETKTSVASPSAPQANPNTQPALEDMTEEQAMEELLREVNE